MGYKEKGLSQEIETILDLVKGEEKSIEGVYLGRRDFGESAVHAFRVADGKIMGCWGAKDLDIKLAGEEHKKVRATFLEKRDIGNGRTLKVYKVEVDEG